MFQYYTRDGCIKLHDATFESIVAQNETKFLLDNLEESIIIISPELRKIEYANDRFIKGFKKVIQNFSELHDDIKLIDETFVRATDN